MPILIHVNGVDIGSFVSKKIEIKLGDQNWQSNSVFCGGERVITYKDLQCKICHGTGKNPCKYSYAFDSSDTFYTACDECGGSGQQDLEINKEEK